jgi:uncharacterized protein (TIGR00369 family)
MSDTPKGFSPFPRSSPFLDLIGPLCWDGNAEAPRFGFRVDERHANARGFAHGGVLTTIADLTLGYTVMMSAEPPPRGITVTLTTDFAGSARIGDWIEAQADIQHVGRSMAFANCYLSVDGRRIVRASAVFRLAAKSE